MSQDKRSHVLAASKWREQVARELEMVAGHDVGSEELLNGGVGFDVHAAREHAKALIALEDEQAAFEDWTREQGRGPENREPGAFDCRHCQTCLGAGKYWAADMSGLEAGFVRCHCEGESLRRGGWPGKLARQWPGDSRAPMGRAYARLGRRILDALDGQPGECDDCLCYWLGALGRGPHPYCQACNGTGHNLRGVLPAVEWSAQARRKMADEQDARAARHHGAECMAPPTWLMKLPISGVDLPARTRTVARGQHWDIRREGPDDGTEADVRISKRGWYTMGGTDGHNGRDLLPGWLRGHLRHDEQRRERAKPRCSWCEGETRGQDPCDVCASMGVM